jgi:hypothetical protein
MNRIQGDAGPVSRHHRGREPRYSARHEHQTVLTPADQKTGNVIYPYENALG